MLRRNSAGLTTYSLITGGTGGFWGPQTTTTIDGQQICKWTTPFKGLTQVEVERQRAAAERLRRQRHLSGPGRAADRSDLGGAERDAAPSLGRPLAGGARTVNVPLIAPTSCSKDASAASICG